MPIERKTLTVILLKKGFLNCVGSESFLTLSCFHFIV